MQEEAVQEREGGRGKAIRNYRLERTEGRRPYEAREDRKQKTVEASRTIEVRENQGEMAQETRGECERRQ